MQARSDFPTASLYSFRKYYSIRRIRNPQSFVGLFFSLFSSEFWTWTISLLFWGFERENGQFLFLGLRSVENFLTLESKLEDFWRYFLTWRNILPRFSGALLFQKFSNQENSLFVLRAFKCEKVPLYLYQVFHVWKNILLSLRRHHCIV